ncbi:hypothetical protein [Lewinella sp. JB7]|uniref:hypothetical protein n=1 Tax=Lewinella sp. JB7 TaxID=2962887 RepID=UPI0020C9A606|nr:hypothetical protein [Lewinella sp. JB7]MCP9234709.1 hypothetical protein [Lewinella sp. JB7]
MPTLVPLNNTLNTIHPMLTRHLTGLLLPCLLFTSLAAQDAALPAVLGRVQEALETVETDRYRYDQELSFAADRPWEATVTITSVNRKNDKSETLTYALNLSDLDPRLINYQDERDRQLVVLKTRNRQNFIRVTEEDGSVDYESEVSLWSPEIDRAKTLRDLLREAIPLAESAWERDFTPGTTLPKLQRWLADAVQPFAEDGTTREVRWSPGDPLADQVTFEITDPDKGTTTRYHFSLADVATNTVEVRVNRGSVSVEAGTVGGEDLILETDGEGSVKYTDEVEIPIAGIDEARRLIQTLTAALPLAREIRDARMPRPTEMNEALESLAGLVTGSETPDARTSAVLTPEALSTLEVIRTERDKESEQTSRYSFHFADLDPGKIALNTRSGELAVVVPTVRDADYVQYWQDGEAKGYDDAVEFPVSSIEDSRKVRELLPVIVERARELPTEAGDLAWLSTALTTPAEASYTQELSLQSDAEGECQWSFTRSESGRKTKEILYEFNLYDLDAAQIDVAVRGDDLSLRIPTLSREKIINVYEDDEPAFTEEMRWNFGNLSDARKAAETLRASIAACRN